MGPGLVDRQELLCTPRSTWLATLEDMACDAGDGDDLNRHVADDAAHLPAILQDRRKGEALVEPIKNMPERAQYVMNMDHAHGMLLKDIAAALNMTGNRMCPLQSRSTVRLRSEPRAW